jgi:hypothetical protein
MPPRWTLRRVSARPFQAEPRVRAGAETQRPEAKAVEAEDMGCDLCGNDGQAFWTSSFYHAAAQQEGGRA